MTQRKKLRLLVTKNCNRSCPGCCNKDWDLDALPAFKLKNVNDYKEIIITGGEPLLYTDKVMELINDIGYLYNYTGKIFIYTAKTNIKANIVAISSMVDGMTITLHNQKDADTLAEYESMLYNIHQNMSRASYHKFKYGARLNVFKGIDISMINHLEQWRVKKDIVWIKDCPLPKDEVFMKYIIK